MNQTVNQHRGLSSEIFMKYRYCAIARYSFLQSLLSIYVHAVHTLVRHRLKLKDIDGMNHLVVRFLSEDGSLSMRLSHV